MKKLSLLIAFALAGLFCSAQTNLTFNVCGYMSSVNPNTPAANATLSGYVTQSNGTTIAQFTATTDTSGWFCTQYFTTVPDTMGCAYIGVNITASIPACNGTTTTYSYSEWLCADTTIYVNINGCDTNSAGCSVWIVDSTYFYGFLSAYSSTGTAPFVYQWSNGATTQNIYPNGVYGQYCVTVTDANGCAASDCYYYGSNNNCSASYSYSPDTLQPGTYYFYGSATGTAPFTYTWDFGNGAMGTGQNVSSYFPNGQYYVCLTITDSIGCQNTFCQYITIGSGGNCSVTIYEYADTLNNVNYLYADFIGGNPISYQWTGNGAVLDTTATFTPSAPGQYCVTVADDSGCTATACYSYGQNNNQCYVYFSSYEDSTQPGTVYFYSYPYGTAPFTYYWTFSDGTVDTDANPTHVFSTSNGWDYACVQITDATGCMSSYCDYVYISGGNVMYCSAYFGGSFIYPNGTPGEIFFDDYSWSNSQIVSWNWDFGDGTSSTAQNPSHIYATANYYVICLTITDANGCTNSYCETWYIDPSWWSNNPWGNGNACDANFIAWDDSSFSGLIYLIDLSYGNYLYYTWTFADSLGNTLQTINTQYPFITFTQFGCIDVCLTVTDTVSGCTDTYCDTVCVDSLGNLIGKATNWAISAVGTPTPQNLLSVKTDVKNVSSVSVFPNPASNDLNLKINLAKSETVLVEMFDFTGKTVSSSIMNFRKGANIHHVDLSGEPTGIYFVRVSSETLNHSEKVVKLK